MHFFSEKHTHTQRTNKEIFHTAFALITLCELIHSMEFCLLFNVCLFSLLLFMFGVRLVIFFLFFWSFPYRFAI